MYECIERLQCLLLNYYISIGLPTQFFEIMFLMLILENELKIFLTVFPSLCVL